MCAIFLVFFPLSLASNYAYLALPWMTRMFAPWLNAARE